ncbi:hypothetical protein PLEOSDRAFT_1099226 [Pleurotus ostreatus PC15]|uniref:Uncharacterized protein n=1 Tax=Pleurotus ostreatus (strain PC15) TaxID=1137138 RepID=A0A067PA23_PLEO1|nr:hypothetical protein PLEOSDRAFT_1099226 [Pleurotus ostreatus PC15]
MATLASCLELEKQLEELLVQIKLTDTADLWKEIEQTAQKLANALRVRDTPEDNHTVVGRTELPQTLTLLVSLCLHGAMTPSEEDSASLFEILRLGANLCMDHDENRGHLLEAGFPQEMVAILEGYAEKVSGPPFTEPLDLDVSQLKIVRTAIGVLLNASLGYSPVRHRLISLEAAITIMRLSVAIYPPGLWKRTPHSPDNEDVWELRSGISEWAWRTISELRENNDDNLTVFNPDVLPFFIPSLQAFIPDANKSDVVSDIDLQARAGLLDTDLESLAETCMLLESLSLDIEDVRLSLARGYNFPAEHGGVPCLSVMLDFIEKGNYPKLWYEEDLGWDATDIKRKERAFDICKAAVIKTIVEVAGEEHNDDVLWDDSDPEQPGGPFVCMMVGWIKKYVSTKTQKSADESAIDRDDLAICACLALGNLARREKHAIVLLRPPHSLAPVLTSKNLLSPNSDIKLRHAVIGLLKNVSQSATPTSIIPVELGNAGIIEAIVGSGVWDQQHDAMVEVVQVGAIGVVKHLCNTSVQNAYALILPGSSSSGLDQLLALIKRSDSVAVKSEGTRVLVNVIKSIWSTASSPASDNTQQTVDEKKRQSAMEKMRTPECTEALANLVTRSGKFPLLVNEGIVALSLLSTHPSGALLVWKSLTVPLPKEASPSPPAIIEPTSTLEDAAVQEKEGDNVSQKKSPPRIVVPQHALDMIAAVLRNVDNQANFPVEVRMNACALLMQIGRNTPGTDSVEGMKTALQPALEKVLKKLAGAQSKDEMLAKAIQKLLDSWS